MGWDGMGSDRDGISLDGIKTNFFAFQLLIIMFEFPEVTEPRRLFNFLKSFTTEKIRMLRILRSRELN